MFVERGDPPYSEVDIVLGAEYVELILEDQRQFFEGIVLRNTKFVFVISRSQKSSFLAKKSYCGLSTVDIDKQIKKFFELEDVGEDSGSKKVELFLEHKMIEDHFAITYQRSETGRFMLRLSTKSSITVLNGSFTKAKSILVKAKKRKTHVIRTAYCDFMSVYESQNHMPKLLDSEIIENCYYIPHHIVSNPSSTTTKYRVIFNASAINECIWNVIRGSFVNRSNTSI